jgi:hypothetical protein
MHQLKGLGALQEFEMMVVSELFRRPHQPPTVREDGNHLSRHAAVGLGSMKHSAAVGAVRELVELEHRMLATKVQYTTHYAIHYTVYTTSDAGNEGAVYYTLRYTLHSIHYTLHTAHYTQHCTLYRMLATKCTVCSVQCVVYSV